LSTVFDLKSINVAGHVIGCCNGICNSNFYVCGEAKLLL